MGTDKTSTTTRSPLVEPRHHAGRLRRSPMCSPPARTWSRRSRRALTTRSSARPASPTASTSRSAAPRWRLRSSPAASPTCSRPTRPGRPTRSRLSSSTARSRCTRRGTTTTLVNALGIKIGDHATSNRTVDGAEIAVDKAIDEQPAADHGQRRPDPEHADRPGHRPDRLHPRELVAERAGPMRSTPCARAGRARAGAARAGAARAGARRRRAAPSSSARAGAARAGAARPGLARAGAARAGARTACPRPSSPSDDYARSTPRSRRRRRECSALLAAVDPTRASWSRASWSRASWSTSFNK